MERLTRDALREVLRALERAQQGSRWQGLCGRGRWQLHDGGELDPCSDASGRRSPTNTADEGLRDDRIIKKPNQAEAILLLKQKQFFCTCRSTHLRLD